MLLSRAEFIGSVLGLSIAAAAKSQTPQSTGQVEVRTVTVPFDHQRPSDGAFTLDYFLADRFQPGWPTIFVVGDGQQFYIQRDLWRSWHDRFGPQTNVVGIAGRGFAKGLQDRLGTPSGDQWIEAYRLLRYEQWTADIDAIRKQLVGPSGQILLFGASGGGRLVHEYLARYAAHASAAFTRAAVFSYLDGAFNLQSDHFWEEISEDDRRRLGDILSAHPDRRGDYAKLFQRQNFFVEPDQLAAARTQLISDLAADRKDVIAKLKQDYQLDAIDDLEKGPTGAAIRVRLFEFFAPVASSLDKRSRFRPDLEVSELTGQPLVDLWRAGRLPTPQIDLRALHQARTEVVMLAGRYDHTCDYRTQIALACCYPNHRLLIVDDDHNFKRMAAVPGLNQELSSAWRAGTRSMKFNQAIAALQPLIWRET